MNTTIIKTDEDTQKEVLHRCIAASSIFNLVTCFNDEDGNTIISGVSTEEAQRIMDGLTYTIISRA